MASPLILIISSSSESLLQDFLSPSLPSLQLDYNVFGNILHAKTI